MAAGYLQRLVTRSIGREAVPTPAGRVAPSLRPLATGPQGFAEDTLTSADVASTPPATPSAPPQASPRVAAPGAPREVKPRAAVAPAPGAAPGPDRPPSSVSRATVPANATRSPAEAPTPWLEAIALATHLANDRPAAPAAPRDRVVSSTPAPIVAPTAPPVGHPPDAASPPARQPPIQVVAPAVSRAAPPTAESRPAPARSGVEPRPAAPPPVQAPPRGPSLQIGRIEVSMHAPPPAFAPAVRSPAPAAPRGILSGSALLGQRFGFGQS